MLDWKNKNSENTYVMICFLFLCYDIFKYGIVAFAGEYNLTYMMSKSINIYKEILNLCV